MALTPEDREFIERVLGTKDYIVRTVITDKYGNVRVLVTYRDPRTGLTATRGITLPRREKEARKILYELPREQFIRKYTEMVSKRLKPGQKAILKTPEGRKIAIEPKVEAKQEIPRPEVRRVVKTPPKQEEKIIDSSRIIPLVVAGGLIYYIVSR